jgi:hypothetical protein
MGGLCVLLCCRWLLLWVAVLLRSSSSARMTLPLVHPTTSSRCVKHQSQGDTVNFGEAVGWLSCCPLAVHGFLWVVQPLILAKSTHNSPCTSSGRRISCWVLASVVLGSVFTEQC